MAKVTAPLLGFSSSGQIGSTQVYGKWRGVQYARRYVIPANPNTTAQQQVRQVFSFLAMVYKLQTPYFRAPWTAFAKGKKFTNQNALFSKNIANLQSATDLSAFDFSPGANGGLPPTGIVITAGANQLSIAVSTPTPPTDWTITRAIGVAILDQDPHSFTDATSIEATDATSPYTVVITGLTSAVLYRVGVFLEWVRSDGMTAYGTAVLGSGTPT
jgi:hypothetical protein